MSNTELSIIIVNYNTAELTLNCIESIKRTVESVGFEIIVVDNSSNDGSEDRIRRRHDDIIWINNLTNEGYGRANNIGIATSKGDYLLIINSDVVVAEKTIERCVEYIKENKEIGALGCKLLNGDGSVQKSVYYYTSEYSEVLRQNLLLDYFFSFENSEIKALMGSFLLFPRKAIEQVRGFDPDFFMYCEELDLCTRIVSQGYELKYFDEVSAYHKHGASASSRQWVVKQTYLSKALLIYKKRGTIGYIFYHILFNLNTASNFALMWLLDKEYRRDFWISQRCYYGNLFRYFTIPFLYKRKYGNGKRILR